ncbi:hypothetical protein ACLOJK_022389 [Asimina triloba]
MRSDAQNIFPNGVVDYGTHPELRPAPLIANSGSAISSCILTGIEQIKSDNNIRDAGSHESSRALTHPVVEQKPTSSFPSKQKIIQHGMTEPNAVNRQAAR